MRAWPGGRTQKDAVLAQVRQAISDRRFLSNTPASVFGLVPLLSEGGDLRAFERATGIPGGLALLGDEGLSGRLDDLPAAQAFAIGWIEAVGVDADLSSLPGEMACWLIDETVRHVVTPPPAGADLLADVRDLHRRASAGGDVPRGDWSAARARALAASDALQPMDAAPDTATVIDRQALTAARLAETLAWPPLTSRTVLVDAARIIAAHAAATARDASDLTRTQRAEIDEVMHKLFDETAAQREANPDKYFFPDIFEARFPDLSARFVADLNLTNAAYSASVARCAEHATALLRAA